MPGAPPRADGRWGLLALAALAALVAPAGAAARAPAEDVALALDAAETRVRELERIVAGRARRLGIRPAAPVEPETLEELAARAAELEAVAAFLAARRERLRPPWRRAPARRESARPLRRGGYDEVAALCERLGLDRPPAPAPAPAAVPEARAAEDARWAAVAAWLSGSAEAPRGAELPLLWPARSSAGVRWGRQRGGVDIALRPGAPVLAAAAGTVAEAGDGGVVVIRHGGGLATAYAHLRGVRVAAGRAVARGEVIGRSGPPEPPGGVVHLRFEVRVGGVAADARDHVRPPARRSARAAPPPKTGPRADPPGPGAPAPDCPAPGDPSGGVRAYVATPAGFACEPAAGAHSRKLSRSSTRTPMSSR